MTRSKGAMGFGGGEEEERGGKPAAAGTVDSTADASVPAQTTLLTSKKQDRNHCDLRRCIFCVRRLPPGAESRGREPGQRDFYQVRVGTDVALA